MRIVIAGSESFIGKELKQHCRARNIEFIGLDLAPSKEAGHHQVDIRSPEVDQAIPQNADALIHLAAISRDQDCRKDPIRAFDVNVGGTLNLIRTAQARKVKQFVFASSEWVYGNVQNVGIQTEDSVIDAACITSEYALTKIVGERLLNMAYQRGFCAVTVLRFGIVYGPRTVPLSAVEGLFNEVRTQSSVEVKGSLSTVRRFVHVSDIAEGILSALGQGGYEIFNLSGNTLITLRDVIEQSAALLNRHPTVIETDPQNISIRNPDNQKARKVLGWEPKIDLARGLSSLLTFQERQG